MTTRRTRNRERRALAFANRWPACRGWELAHRGGLLSSTFLARWFEWGAR